MTTIITVETEGLPITKFKVGDKPRKLLISIDEKDGITFEDVSRENTQSKSVPIKDLELKDWYDNAKGAMAKLREYWTDDKKIGESKATAIGPGGVQSKFQYYVDEKGDYYSVRIGPKGYNRFRLGRLDDAESKLTKVYQDIQRFKLNEPFIQTDLERSDYLPYNIKINRSILKSSLEILEILGYVKRIKEKEKLSQKFIRVSEEEVINKT